MIAVREGTTLMFFSDDMNINDIHNTDSENKDMWMCSYKVTTDLVPGFTKIFRDWMYDGVDDYEFEEDKEKWTTDHTLHDFFVCGKAGQELYELLKEYSVEYKSPPMGSKSAFKILLQKHVSWIDYRENKYKPVIEYEYDDKEADKILKQIRERKNLNANKS